MSARMMEFCGLILLIIAVAIAAALFSFNPQDPSFNTATGTQPTNLLGRAGATIADSLIQWLGLASALPILILLAWSWRLVRTHTLGAPLLRFIAAILLLPTGATLISLFQILTPGNDISWPSESGLGGQIGHSFASLLLNALTGEVGHTIGSTLACILALLLLALLLPITLGLNSREWYGLANIITTSLRWIYRLVRRQKAEKSHFDEIPTPNRLFTPASKGPSRYSDRFTPRGGVPSGFLRRNFMRQDPRLPPPETKNNWLQPPTPQGPTPWERASPANPAPATSAITENDTPPNNPYGEKLAQINRVREEPHLSSPLPPLMNDDDEPEDDGSISPSETQTEPEQGFFKRIAHKGLGIFPTNEAQNETDKTAASLESQAGTGLAMTSSSSTSERWEKNMPSPSPSPAESWTPPSVSLLNPPPDKETSGPSEETLQENARLLESVLNDYGVQGTITDYHAGPVVTLYELEPAPGVRSSRVIGLSDDIARSLSVLSVRIATVPGRNVIGIEVPNATRETVYFPELLLNPGWEEGKAKLKLALGKDIAGQPVYADLAKMPHLLVAGTTGSGKSVGINAMILSLLYRLSPEDCRLIMIDPKILELSIYDGIPHLMTPVVTEPSKAVSALKWAVQEMDRRYRLMADHQVRNIAGYNERIKKLRETGEAPTRRVQTGFDPETGRPVFSDYRLKLEHLPYIVIVIDEMADLMMVAGKEIEAAVLRLAQKARAAGIHVIMATQRPSVDVITGTIKANFPTRISFQVTNKYDSRTILGEQGAEQLLGRGDMLFMQGGARITRVHGPFISDEEVEAVVEDLRSKGRPIYNDDIITEEEPEEQTPSRSGKTSDSDQNSDLYEQAVDLVIREKRASTSFVQRHLSIGYNRAANIIDQMEREGIISASNHVGKREVLVSHNPIETHHNDDDEEE
ncbi:DNA translocase FtsK 4TM domain-containing protein [Acetobacteraceae bacterium ESL0709]|nr:DNA translocase FtsK 4TM domain-containing protein [Acetobacteraceae bacterium ESL0697]MDF7678776.1 DNA translocase FtsK 4TM domain-containing protein [Acetobacteraceae bacterium ESL0709]